MNSVIPDAAVLIEEWEKAAAGIEEDALNPSRGILLALGLGVPLDIGLLCWVLL